MLDCARGRVSVEVGAAEPRGSAAKRRVAADPAGQSQDRRCECPQDSIAAGDLARRARQRAIRERGVCQHSSFEGVHTACGFLGAWNHAFKFRP